MILITEIMTALCFVVLMAAKKKSEEPIFGQMTLTSEKALEYLKTDLNGFTRKARKIIWITPLEAQAQGFAVPDWVVNNLEKFQWSAIVVDESSDVLPLFVYQNSALQALEKLLARFEEKGAEIEQVSPREMQVSFGDSTCDLKFWRNEKGGQYARYHLEVETE